EKQLTQSEAPLLEFAWAPEGEAFAFTALVPERLAAPPWAPSGILPWLRSRAFVQLFVTNPTGPRQISTGAPNIIGEPAWMLDGRSVVAARDDGRIYSFPVAGGAPKQLTDEPGRNERPLPSPEGARIAWLSTQDDRQSYATRKICVMN